MLAVGLRCASPRCQEHQLRRMPARSRSSAQHWHLPFSHAELCLHTPSLQPRPLPVPSARLSSPREEAGSRCCARVLPVRSPLVARPQPLSGWPRPLVFPSAQAAAFPESDPRPRLPCRTALARCCTAARVLRYEYRPPTTTVNTVLQQYHYHYKAENTSVFLTHHAVATSTMLPKSLLRLSIRVRAQDV